MCWSAEVEFGMLLVRTPGDCASSWSDNLVLVISVAKGLAKRILREKMLAHTDTNPCLGRCAGLIRRCVFGCCLAAPTDRLLPVQPTLAVRSGSDCRFFVAIFSTATDRGSELRRILRGEEYSPPGFASDHVWPFLGGDLFNPRFVELGTSWDFCFSVAMRPCVQFRVPALPREVWLAKLAELAAVNWAFFLDSWKASNDTQPIPAM